MDRTVDGDGRSPAAPLDAAASVIEHRRVVRSHTVPADRFAMATPGDWLVLPLAPATRDRRIQRLVEQQLGKDDRIAYLRRLMIVELRKAAARAEESGAFFAAMSSRTVGDRPLSASVTAFLTKAGTDREGVILDSVDAIEATLAADDDPETEILEHSVVDLQVGPAARIRKRVSAGVERPDGEQALADNVQFCVPLPEAQQMLTLVFSTPVLPLADAYAELFDLMAETARWVEARPEEPDR